jgi:phage N-6-adenine-methyltransferase
MKIRLDEMIKPPPNYQEWQTPRKFFDLINSRWNFDVDLFASKENALLPTFFTKKDDVYKQDLSKFQCAFGNPPYLEEEKAFDFCYAQAHEHDTKIALLIKCDTSTKLFHDIYNHAGILLVTPRISFQLPKKYEASKNRPRFSSMLVLIGPDIRKGVIGRINHKTGKFLP